MRLIPFIMVTALSAPAPAGVTLPFTETFNTDTAGWRNAAGAALDWTASGSFDGSGFASASFNFANNASGEDLVMIRGQDGFDSSGDAFVGNWLSSGVGEFSTYVRHDGPGPLNFFARFASPFNFPGAVAIEFTPVEAGEWTQLTFSIDALNPQFVTFEGSDFTSVFSNIGNIQIGVRVSDALAGLNQVVTFDIDNAAIAIPAPGAATWIAMAGLAAIRRRR